MIYKTVKSLVEFFGLPSLLFGLSFFSIYFFQVLSPFLNVVILLYAYRQIIKHHRFDFVIMLVLFSRCINGFVIPHNYTIYNVFNVLTNVMPLPAYVFGLYLSKLLSFSILEQTKRFKFTLLFFVVLTFGFVVHFSTMGDLVTKRYMPLLLFVVFTLFITRKEDLNINALLQFFRVMFLCSIIIYFLPGYVGITTRLMESDSIFSVASPPRTYSLAYMGFTRNMAFIWDHRIAAILAYLYLLLSLINKPKFYGIDILLSAVLVVISTSRGSMVTYGFVLAAYLFIKYRFRFVLVTALAAGSVAFLAVKASGFLPPKLERFVLSFNPASKSNALNQRKIFADYGLEAYRQNKLFGNGVGYLSSTKINRYLLVDKVRVPTVGDAFWYVLLGEMGLVGVVLYALFLMEVFHSSSLLNLALLAGFALQLLGTDIPDMRFYYFAILVLVYTINTQLSSNLAVKHEPAKN